MSQMLDRKNKMFDLINWKNEIGAAAGLYQGSRKNWLARAAHKSGGTYQQIESLFYGRCNDPKVSVALGVLSAAERERNEARALATKFEMAAGVLNESNKDRNRDDVLALLRAARALRDMDTGILEVKKELSDNAVVSPIVQMVEHAVAETPAAQGKMNQ